MRLPSSPGLTLHALRKDFYFENMFRCLIWSVICSALFTEKTNELKCWKQKKGKEVEPLQMPCTRGRCLQSQMSVARVWCVARDCVVLDFLSRPRGWGSLLAAADKNSSCDDVYHPQSRHLQAMGTYTDSYFKALSHSSNCQLCRERPVTQGSSETPVKWRPAKGGGKKQQCVLSGWRPKKQNKKNLCCCGK